MCIVLTLPELLNCLLTEDWIPEPTEEEQIMKNPLLNLWLRFESEKKNILQKLKGQASHYLVILGMFLLFHLHIMYLY